MSNKGWMEKEAILYKHTHTHTHTHTHSGVLLSHQKEHIWVSPDEVDEPRVHYTEGNKSERKTSIVYWHIYMESRMMVLINLFFWCCCSLITALHASLLLLQLCPTLGNPMDCSLTGSSVRGTLQAGIVGWVAMPSSRGSFRPRDQICVSFVSWIGRQVLCTSTTWEAQ